MISPGVSLDVQGEWSRVAGANPERHSLLSCRVRDAHSNVDYLAEAEVEKETADGTELEPSGDTVVKDVKDPEQADVFDPREYHPRPAPWRIHLPQPLRGRAAYPRVCHCHHRRSTIPT